MRRIIADRLSGGALGVLRAYTLVLAPLLAGWAAEVRGGPAMGSTQAICANPAAADGPPERSSNLASF
ncbi:hypothetical protein CKO38_16015 [Rhodospirillum rubrum]|uniref:hypothetical protein n=1 Tax=Rhodospirillum rubrum TaxID=1085 RepID=UPI0019087344|nr:hypothetical protein [Rhodospirillum rubrum]MBK1665456.1 hypothetical protein [Rhodospirillum rubrum]MBK1678149.1 hypothetical protein [Rhodospirillum rubrum]